MSKRNRSERRRQRSSEATPQVSPLHRLPNPEAPPNLPVMSLQVRAHSGPLPDPQTLYQYNQIAPGAAQRIISMGEREQAHRHRCDLWEGVYGFFGMICAFAIGIAGLAAGVYLGVNQQAVLGGTVITVTLGTLATTFIFGRKRDTGSSTPVSKPDDDKGKQEGKPA